MLELLQRGVKLPPCFIRSSTKGMSGIAFYKVSKAFTWNRVSISKNEEGHFYAVYAIASYPAQFSVGGRR